MSDSIDDDLWNALSKAMREVDLNHALRPNVSLAHLLTQAAFLAAAPVMHQALDAKPVG